MLVSAVCENFRKPEESETNTAATLLAASHTPEFRRSGVVYAFGGCVCGGKGGTSTALRGADAAGALAAARAAGVRLSTSTRFCLGFGDQEAITRFITMASRAVARMSSAVKA